jgi:hypothetical protein
MNTTFKMDDSNKSKYQNGIKETLVANNHLLEHLPRGVDDDMNKAMKSIFHIIHKNAESPDANNNDIFKKYLCEILKGEHPYNIFNTYLYIEQYAGFYKYYIPFFVILSLKKNTYFDINDIYLNELKLENNKDNSLYETEIKKIYDVFNGIFDNPNEPLYDGYTYTNMDIIEIILNNHLIHVDIIDANKKDVIVKYDPSNTPLPWAIYCKNEEFLKLFNKMNNFRLPSETVPVDPETVSIDPETVSEPETTTSENTSDTGTTTDTVLGTALYKKTDRINRINTRTIRTGRRTTGYGRKTRGRHRHGGKYTKRMPNKGKSPVRQTKRIKLKQKTHKRRST